MKIIFDNIIFSLQNAGGISVVWYELLSRVLIRKDIIFECIEFKGAKQNIFRKCLNLSQTDITSLSKRFLRIIRYLDVKINLKTQFIFHSSYYRICSNPNAINITTVHDFTYEYFSKGISKKIHCWQKHRSIRKSDYIICISKNTKNDLLYFLPEIDTKKIHVIHNGVSNDFKPLNNAQYNIEQYQPYILFVGSRAEYKNFKLTVEAIGGTEFNLIIVGPELTSDEKSIINSILGMERIINKQGLSNEDLNVLYNHAFCLLYPSSYEGFGIPVLEAQKSGCPVIAYNGSSIPEIIGDTPLLLEQLSVSEVLNKIDLLRDTTSRSEIIQNGFENVKRFDWDVMGEKVIALYDKIIQ